MAFPEMSQNEREQILRRCFQNLGRLLVEFTHFPRLSKGNISQYVVHDGLENYLEGLRRGRGVIFMTAHFGHMPMIFAASWLPWNLLLARRVALRPNPLWVVPAGVALALTFLAGHPRVELFRIDGLHLNEKGYEVLNEAVRPYVHQ